MRSDISGVYVHYKSDELCYEVMGVGRSTETDEEYVIYKPLYDKVGQPEFWVRPISMFLGKVDLDGQLVPRFRKVEK